MEPATSSDLSELNVNHSNIADAPADVFMSKFHSLVNEIIRLERLSNRGLVVLDDSVMSEVAMFYQDDQGLPDQEYKEKLLLMLETLVETLKQHCAKRGIQI